MSQKCQNCFGTGYEPDQAVVGRKMRKLRVKSGFQIAPLAHAMGISPSYLSDLERGRRDWTLTLRKRFTAAVRNRK